ncbi:MAG: TIGR01906 family membrane protein [Dehalococcoidia bacterium]
MLLARWLTGLLFVIALPLLIVLTNVRIAATEPRIQMLGFGAYDVAATTGVSRIELDQAARDISRYFSDDRPALGTRVHIAGEEVALFNPREVGHMRDVKALMQDVFRLQEFAFAYVATYVCIAVLWSRERSLRRLARLCVIGGVLTCAVLGVAAAAMMVGFEQMFVEFHMLSFSNDLWQLDPRTDHLVQMFPIEFWFRVSMVVGILAIIEGAAIALGGAVYLVRSARPPWRARRSSEEVVHDFTSGGLPAR